MCRPTAAAGSSSCCGLPLAGRTQAGPRGRHEDSGRSRGARKRPPSIKQRLSNTKRGGIGDALEAGREEVILVRSAKNEDSLSALLPFYK